MSYIWSPTYICPFQLHFALPVLAHGVSSTLTSIMRSFITPLSITSRLPQDLLPRLLLTTFSPDGTSACLFYDCCSTLLIIWFREVFGHKKYSASYLTVPQVSTSVAYLSECCQAQESQAQALSWCLQLYWLITIHIYTPNCSKYQHLNIEGLLGLYHNVAAYSQTRINTARYPKKWCIYN